MAYKFNPFTGKLDNTGPSISTLNLLGTVANEAALPGSATTGDVYQAADTGVFYVWDGSTWDNIGTFAGPQGPQGPQGPAGADGTDGADGADGADGVGVIAGGTTGQALVKASNTDYDTQWSDVTAVAALNDLTDVTIASPSDGQVLEYDSVTSAWVNATPSTGLSDGNKGDITVSGSGSSWTIDSAAVTFAKIQDLNADVVLGRTGTNGDVEEISCTSFARSLLDDANAATARATLGIQDVFIIACSNEDANLTVGTAKVTFRMPYAATLTAVKASVTTAPTGSNLIIDINEGGTTVFSTPLSIDATELTSTTAATPAVISDSSLADDAVITIDIDQIGSTVAGTGLKVYLYVTKV